MLLKLLVPFHDVVPAANIQYVWHTVLKIELQVRTSESSFTYDYDDTFGILVLSNYRTAKDNGFFYWI